MASMHHHIRYCMPFVRIACGDPGLPVLITLISHANIRNRAYPSYEGLMLTTGLSKPSIKKAVDGLSNLSMIRVIDVSERANEEKKLDTRLNIYELSGYMKLGDFVVPYLYTDYAKMPVKITALEDVQFEELVNDVYLNRLTTFTDMVNHVYSKKIYQEEHIPLKGKEKTLVAPPTVVATVASSEYPQHTPVEPVPTTGTPKAKRKKTDAPPAILVNLTNEKLHRPRPDGITDEEHTHWLKQKPIWSLFAMYIVWDKTQGWQDRSVANYQTKAPAKHWTAVVSHVQEMGRWLDEWQAEADTPEITYELLIQFDEWYHAQWGSKPIGERLYPTKRESFDKNFGDFLTFIAEPEMA